jgi:HEAT repeat protein
MHEKGYPAIPALMENFEDEDDGAWRFAVDAVAFLGEPSANHLIEAAKSENARRRAGGVRGIGLLRADIKIAHDKEMVPLLVKGLKDEHVEVRRWSAFALGLYGPMGEGATTIPAQIEALEREQDTHVLCYLLEAIGGHGEGARAAVPVVVKLYKESKDQFVRGAAGIAISHFKANGLYQPAEGELPANDEPRPPARRPEPPAGRP